MRPCARLTGRDPRRGSRSPGLPSPARSSQRCQVRWSSAAPGPPAMRRPSRFLEPCSLPGIDTVFVASGVNFPDALAAAPKLRPRAEPIAPNCRPAGLPAAVQSEDRAVAPARIVVVGARARSGEPTFATSRRWRPAWHASRQTIGTPCRRRFRRRSSAGHRDRIRTRSGHRLPRRSRRRTKRPVTPRSRSYSCRPPRSPRGA